MASRYMDLAEICLRFGRFHRSMPRIVRKHRDPEDDQAQRWPVKVVEALPTLEVPCADPTGPELGLRSFATGRDLNVGLTRVLGS